MNEPQGSTTPCGWQPCGLLSSLIVEGDNQDWNIVVNM